MLESLLPLLRCPVSRSRLELKIISTTEKFYNGKQEQIIHEAVLFAESDWFYPVIDGIPRLLIEAFLDYREFLQKHMADYKERRSLLEHKYGGLIRYAVKKNYRTKQSFERQWSVFNYDTDRTWEADADGMLQRFLKETAETTTSLQSKLIFDAGCGNGYLNQFIAHNGAVVLGMDLSRSIERAFQNNNERNAYFIQGDIQFPPVAFDCFDIVHSSGVLHHTNNTELSFSCIEPCVKKDGKLSVWLYQPRKDFIHNLFNSIRNFSSKLPIRFQYYLYLVSLFPISYVVKRIKGNKQNKREMMIAILDWFSPQFRWEQTTDEAEAWFLKRNFHDVMVTTNDIFGFNMTARKF